MKFKIDKIFIIISAIFLSFMVGFYGSRMIYYYKNESKLIKNANNVSQESNDYDKFMEKLNLLKDDNDELPKIKKK